MTEDVREGELLAGKYQVERVLGRGGMGVVYLAKHVELDKLVAIKLMLPEAARSAEAVARFMREARSAAKITSQHVVRVSDVGMLEGTRPYMAMEYLQGSDLHQLLTERKRLPLADTAEYLLQALEALAEAHALGIVHRDLKPGNLFVTHRPHDTPIVKVLDFGISKIQHGNLSPASPLTHLSALVGSPLYMSPEQMKASRDVDQRTDIWAMGIVLHELLTGEVPFKGETLPELCAMIVLDADPPRARDWVPELPAAIDEVIARCLARNVDARYANAAELARALAPFAPERARVSVDRIAAVLGPASLAGSKGGSTLSALSDSRRTSTSWVDSAPRGLKRRGTLALIPLVGLVALGLVALWAHRSQDAPAVTTNAAVLSPAVAVRPDPIPQPAPKAAAPAISTPPSAVPVPSVEPRASAAAKVTPAGSKRKAPTPPRAPATPPHVASEFGGRR